MHTFKYKVSLTDNYTNNTSEVHIEASVIKNDGYFLVFEDTDKVVAMFSKHNVLKVTVI